jgi:hypothetical protein
MELKKKKREGWVYLSVIVPVVVLELEMHLEIVQTTTLTG